MHRKLLVEVDRLHDLADDLKLRLETGDPDVFGELQVIALIRTAGRIDNSLDALAAVEDVQRKVIPLFPTRERTHP